MRYTNAGGLNYEAENSAIAAAAGHSMLKLKFSYWNKL